MPLLVSEYGYGLGIAAEETVLCCNIPMYGTYLYTEGDRQIDYYFLCERTMGKSWNSTKSFRRRAEERNT